MYLHEIIQCIKTRKKGNYEIVTLYIKRIQRGVSMQCIDDVGVGARLKELRLQKHMKEIDAAMELEVSTAQYSRFENGKASISVDVLNKAHRFYQCSMDYILSGEEEEKHSVFFDKLVDFQEKDKRRFLKILCCLMGNDSRAKMNKEDPMYKIFVDGLLEMIPIDAESTIMYVLNYEKNRLKISENAMIELLGLSRFRWTSIMDGNKVGDILIPIKIRHHFGYDLEFLINNKITENLFFDKMYQGCSKKKREQVMHLFEGILQSEEELLK